MLNNMVSVFIPRFDSSKPEMGMHAAEVALPAEGDSIFKAKKSVVSKVGMIKHIAEAMMVRSKYVFTCKCVIMPQTLSYDCFNVGFKYSISLCWYCSSLQLIATSASPKCDTTQWTGVSRVYYTFCRDTGLRTHCVKLAHCTKCSLVLECSEHALYIPL